ncbi:Protein serine/threonine phosphatase PrpC, regulation of stationary phase [hydrothermal vent metagenome]|uniref:Protein serine/threonine phosphatase PrpC, regulation of stationary phase n=1 Tax=hydrothermal vent metagenome TaxID=652676 RepID=A0A3B0YVS2_9ZZZZ
MTDRETFQWISAGITDVGKVRKINEDAFTDRPDNGLWVVADGMGGHAAGDFASQAIVESLNQVGQHERLSLFIDEVEDRLLKVNQALIDEAASREESTTIGSTVVALIALEKHCACLWAGDSRAYRLRGGQMTPVSQDHSQVEELIEQGMLLREDAESHPAANVITRAVGADEQLFVDVELVELQDGDRFLLCSDGLFKEVSEPEIAEHMQRGSSQELCHDLIELALERGSRDNVTVVAVDFNKVQ